MKKSLLVSLVVLAGTICASLTSGITKVEAKAVAEYEANIHPINVTADAEIYETYKAANMVDGDETTFAWFAGRPSEIVLDYGKVFELHDVYLANGKHGGGDLFFASLEYSVDNLTWTSLGNLYEDVNAMENEVTLDIYENPVEARYLKLVDQNPAGGWVAIREFKVNSIDNSNEIRVSYENLEIENVYNNTIGYLDPNNMIDDDNSTATWFQNMNTEGAAIILSYREAREISYIELMMGKVGSFHDYMEGVNFFYKTSDDADWKQIGGTFEGISIRAVLESPITVKHVKAVATTTKVNGLIVREFSTGSKSPITLVNCYEYASLRDTSMYPEELTNFRNITDGNLNTHADLAVLSNAAGNREVIYDLDAVKNVENVTVVTNAPWGDTLVDANGSILSSLDGNDWTDITSLFTFTEETGTYELTNANFLARYVKIETTQGWLGLTEFAVEATGTELQASFGGAYNENFEDSKFGLRFLIPVLQGTEATNYKAVAKTAKQEVTFNYGTNLVEVTGGLQLTLSLGDIINNFNRLTTEFTVTGYYNNCSVGEITYSVESIVREYLYLNLIGHTELSLNQIEFLTRLNDHIQSQDIEPEPIVKVDPVIEFSIESGTTLTIGESAIPTATVSEGANYTIHFSSDTTGYYSEEFPTEPGTYSIVVTVLESDTYNYLKDYRWFRLVAPKLTPVVTFSDQVAFTYDGNPHTPTFTVTEGLEYTYHYDFGGENLGTEVPTKVGWYSLVVDVEGNDEYNSLHTWCVFHIDAPAE